MHKILNLLTSRRARRGNLFVTENKICDKVTFRGFNAPLYYNWYTL